MSAGNTNVPVVEVVGFDHIVLRCADVEQSLHWYTHVLGMAEVRVDEWRNGRAPFPSVRADVSTIIDLIPAGAPFTERNLDHFCLVVADGVVDAVAAARDSFRVVDGPDHRYGARGDGWSVYVLDPDDNVVELRSYPQ
jgi:catechol 2,3-dioxygenase-like lactoylglutathione lyase family enzyme